MDGCHSITPEQLNGLVQVGFDAEIDYSLKLRRLSFIPVFNWWGISFDLTITLVDSKIHPIRVAFLHI